MSDFLTSFILSITQLKITEKDRNILLKLCAKLVSKLNSFNLILIEEDNDMSASQVLDVTSKFVNATIFNVDSKYKRDKSVKANHSYVAPREVAIGTRYELRKKKVGGRVIKIPRLIQSKYYYVSILSTLESLFSHEAFAEMYFDYNLNQKHECQPGKYVSFCCGSVYKSIELFRSNPESLQLQASSDDFEPCNALGSKNNKHKVCALYVTVQNIPSKYSSKCKFVFLVALCNTDDINMKHTDFNNIWYPVVNEITQLEDVGITITGRPKLKGTLTELVFDNLGANTSMGYVKSFNSNHYCRFCQCHRSECQSMVEENSNEVRTVESYNEQINIVAESTKVDYSETKGVKYYCLLSNLRYFHIVSHPTADIMHDLNEGVVPYTLKLFFNQFGVSKIMSMDDISMRVQFFEYGFLEKRNIPSPIDVDRRSLGQNASQSLCLIRNVPFIFWSYRNHPELSTLWKCIGALLQIIEIVYSQELTEDDVIELEQKVKEFCSLIVNTGHNLTPKMHFMLHYPRIFRMMGPIIRLNMLKYDRKHAELKKYATRNFKNINQSIAQKHQELLALKGISIEDDVELGHRSDVCIDQKISLEENFDVQIDEISEVKSMTINNYAYRKDLFIIFESRFYQIVNILIADGRKYLRCKPFETVSFQIFLNSFEIKKIISADFVSFDVSSLKNPKTYEIKYSQSNMYIRADNLDMQLNKRFV